MLNRLIVIIECRFEQAEGGDAAHDVSDFTRFFDSESASQEFAFTVAEPFFDDLIAADGVIPDARGDILPVDYIYRLIQSKSRPMRSSVIFA